MKKYTKIYLILTLFMVNSMLVAQDRIIPLWPNEVPNQIKVAGKEIQEKDGILWITKVLNPTIEVYLPAKQNANGQAVLIFPGGGYHGLAYDWEGTDIAKTLNARGVAGIVVKYRLPEAEFFTEKKDVPLQDAQRALRMVRFNAEKWNIDPNKIGIMGFSAGGHLASTLGTHYTEEVYAKRDAMDSLSARPDFMILMYAVITFGETNAHIGSRSALIGENPSQEDIAHYSNELQVNANTPPTLLVHAADDEGVPVENSLLFFKALKKNKVPVTMYIYPSGGHGFSLALKDNHLRKWVGRMFDWLESME
ncbi:MAG: esterase [Flavobacteriaceae bacterium]|nr:MAG: esterase [Flavobacteriaceae bacterium]